MLSKWAVPSVIPAADADAYPTPSTLKVLEFPPAFQHHAAYDALLVLIGPFTSVVKPSGLKLLTQPPPVAPSGAVVFGYNIKLPRTLS